MAGQTEDERFQPGQLGLKHLLGVTAVVCIVVALSAAKLRTMPPLQSVQWVAHWTLVGSLAGLLFYTNAVRRRRDRVRSGALQLRVMRRPVAGGERRLYSWLLIAAVVADGLLMSVVILPLLPPTALFKLLMSSPFAFLALVGGQGALWAYCLHHCLGSVYWIEFRENGVLTHAKYYPWNTITRIGWSPMNPGNLVMLHGGRFEEMTIDPASRADVDDLLERRSALVVSR